MNSPTQEPFDERRREPRGKGAPQKRGEPDRQVDLGGADAVPDTPQVAARGAEPNARPAAGPVARVGAGGTSAFVWVGLVLLAVVAAIFAIRLF